MNDAPHTILRLWIRPIEGGPLEEAPQLVLKAGRGVVGDHSFDRLRHVTIVFQDDWNAAARDVGHPVDPIGRRANVLVSGGAGARFVGTKLQLGPAILEIKGITSPCPVMEKAAPGMMQALRPEGRSGIWARVLLGGTIQQQDLLEALERRSVDPSLHESGPSA